MVQMLHHRVLASVSEWCGICIGQLQLFAYSPVAVVSFWFTQTAYLLINLYIPVLYNGLSSDRNCVSYGLCVLLYGFQTKQAHNLLNVCDTKSVGTRAVKQNETHIYLRCIILRYERMGAYVLHLLDYISWLQIYEQEVSQRVDEDPDTVLSGIKISCA
jgi:hypothetical protein